MSENVNVKDSQTDMKIHGFSRFLSLYLACSHYFAIFRVFSLRKNILSFFEKALDKMGDVWYTIEVESQDSRCDREVM